METAIAMVGETSSVESLYRRDADRLWRALYAFAGDAEVASDAMAEAYAQLIGRGSAVNDPAAWTWRAAFRICAGALKDRRTAPTLSPATNHTDRYTDPDLLAALARLPQGQRAAVILFYYADLPVGEIAHRLGSNGVAVRANLSRGRRRLRELLGDNNG
jgi:RNA polymerase sigma-70 factor (ECF subfamily)